MAIRNNTTSLGMGGSPGGGGGGSITARQFNDYTARSISTEVARANYRKSVRSEYKIAELRQYVFKMVSSFSEEDKMAILAEYGDAKLVNSKKLNEAVTETLIIRLKEEDLQLLLKDIRGDETKLSRKVQRMRSNQKRMASKFGTGSFEDVYAAARNLKGSRSIQNALKKYDRNFKIPRPIRKMFKPLRKELTELIPLIYDIVEITGLATTMQIDFSEGLSKKELIKLIVDKTILYVAIITGKTNATYGGAIVDPEPFKLLLSYTSTPYLGGSSGLTKSGTKSLREEMLLAKAQMKESIREKKTTMGVGKKGILKTVGYNILKPLALPGALIEGALGIPAGVIGGLLGGVTSLVTGGKAGGIVKGARAGFETLGAPGDFLKNPFNVVERRLEKKARQRVRDKGEKNERLKQLTTISNNDPQELFEIAKKYGLNPRKDKELLIEEILIQEEKKKIRLERLEKKANKLGDKGKVLSQREKAEIDALEKDLGGKGPFAGKKSGTEIPYIKFSKTGPDIASWLTLGVALPVYVVNHYEIGGGSSKSSEGSSKSSEVKLGKLADTFKGIDDKFTTGSGVMKATTLKVPDYIEHLDTTNINTQNSLKMEYGENTKDYSGINRTDTIFKGLYRGDDPFIVDMKYGDQMFDTKGTRALRVIDVSPVIMASKAANKKSSDAARGIFSPTAVNLGVMRLKPEPATPVYVVNKSLPTDAGTLILALARILLKILVPFGGGILADELDSLAAGNSLGGNVSSVVSTMLGLASGGKGKGLPRFAKGTKKSSVSSFIAGDSLNGKPNEEQVSIDWNKKEFRVKPIPSMTSQELNKSGVSQVSRMSSAERNEPMKVYAVNPGITDMIDIGSAKVSMIGLVADMAGRLASIEGLLSIGNQQGVAIATATAATASNTSKLASKSSGSSNPFAGGFPSDLDNILIGM